MRAPFNRAVALLHDFWYDEAQRQFEAIAKADPECAIAHWGTAMSIFHQIWDRPDEGTMAHGRAEMQKAAAPAAKSARERAYIAALGRFYAPGELDYQARIDAYSAAMGALYRRYPNDADAGAFYALSLLAAEAPDDTSLAHEREALAVLDPLLRHIRIIPGSCTTSFMPATRPRWRAKDWPPPGTTARSHLPGAHAVHMPGHIFARLGMWQADIDANLASVAASQAAQAVMRATAWISSTPTIFCCMPICKADRRRAPRA